MKLSRRQFTSILGSGLLLSHTQVRAFLANKQDKLSPIFVSAASDKADNHWLVVLDKQGLIKHQLALPSRAHQINIQPNAPILAVAARRPGTYLKIVDAEKGEIIHHISPNQGQHFYGHSSYSANGRYLYTTENHIESGEGLIVVRDTETNYQVINSFPSHGIGPHEIKLHPDGKTLIVANGGILTHPDSGRTKLNLDTMSPSLVYLDANNGELLEKKQLPGHLHQLSIRHIDINKTGLTAVALQYQGAKSDRVPLILLHKKGQNLKTLWAPEHINKKMKNYCGSICFNKSGSIFAVTSPRGNLITLWDAIDGEYITQYACDDVCGVSQFGRHGFAFSNGLGELYTFDMRSSVLKLVDSKEPHNLAWDNHLSTNA